MVRLAAYGLLSMGKQKTGAGRYSRPSVDQQAERLVCPTAAVIKNRASQAAVEPPSTTSSAPVTNVESSLARK